MSTRRVAIIGGGYSGLSAGLDLARNGVRPTIYEAARVAGGLAACVKLGDTSIEKFYHHWFNHDRDIIDLARELGLGKHLVRRATVTSTFRDDRVYRLSSPVDLMRFKPLSVIDRLRFGRMVLRSRAVKDYRKLYGVTARQWIIDTAGPAVYDVVWRPLFEGKFGKYADRISAVWFWSKLQTRGRSRSAKQSEELLYLDGGFERLTRAMTDDIVGNGGRIQLGCPVRKIRRTDGAWEVLTDDGAQSFDQILLTTPTPISMKLLDDFPDTYRARAGAIPYLGVTALMLVMNRPLSQTYWLNVNDTSYPFVGVIEHTNMQPPEAYGGRHIAYVTKYRDDSHETVGMGSQALLELWQGHLQRMFPEFETSCVDLAMSWRNSHAQPVILAGSEDRILPAATPLPDVWICNMAQIFPEDRGTNYAVRLGRRTAKQMLEAPSRHARRHQIVRVTRPEESRPDVPAIQPAAAYDNLYPA